MNNFNISIKRVGYGTPERIKISEPLPEYSPNVAYWLDSDVELDPSLNPANNGGHPWSRITYSPKKETTRRVESSDVSDDASAGDLLAMMAPEEITDSRRAIADSIDVKASNVGKSREIVIKSVTVSGATFYEGKTVSIDLENLPAGLTQLTGKGNGSGKSSLLAFCSPFPVVVGKDTTSGRPSAIKEFFISKPASIEKLLTVNGVEHRHLITIKAPGLASAKTECYLYIDGLNILETTNFDGMMAKCEELYGSLDDHLRTYQYVQPQQGSAPSGLMSATATDLRNVVQNIGGIDRSTERRAALDEAGRLEREKDTLSDHAAGAEAFSVSVESVEAEIKESKEALAVAVKKENASDIDRMSASDTLAIALKKLEQAKEQSKLFEEYKQAHTAVMFDIARLEKEKAALLAVNADEARASLKENKEITEEWTAYNLALSDVRNKNYEAESEYGRKYQLWTAKKRIEEKREADHAAAILYAENEKERLYQKAENAKREAQDARALAEALADPCEKCGHVSADNQSKHDEKDAYAELFDLNADALIIKADEFVIPGAFVPKDIGQEPVKPDPVPEPPKPTEGQALRAQVEQWESDIKEAERAETLIPMLSESIESKKKHLEALDSNPVSYPEDYGILQKSHDDAKSADNWAYVSWKSDITEREAIIARLSELDTSLIKAKKQAEEIAEMKAEVEKLTPQISDWSWVAAMMAPSKLPAFELELILDSIDTRATANIQPFRESSYTIRTETQREGSGGKVDKFNIFVFDKQTGKERSFLQYSPGEKAFISLAYSRALISVNQERTGITFTPFVLDESDGPVDTEFVPAYYAMQEETIGDNKAIVVTHSQDAKHYIPNRVAVEDLVS